MVAVVAAVAAASRMPTMAVVAAAVAGVAGYRSRYGAHRHRDGSGPQSAREVDDLGARYVTLSTGCARLVVKCMEGEGKGGLPMLRLFLRLLGGRD